MKMNMEGHAMILVDIAQRILTAAKNGSLSGERLRLLVSQAFDELADIEAILTQSPDADPNGDVARTVDSAKGTLAELMSTLPSNEVTL